MKKLLAILLTLAMLFTSYAFVMPASAVSVGGGLQPTSWQQGWAGTGGAYDADTKTVTVGGWGGIAIAPNWNNDGWKGFQSVTVNFAEPLPIQISAYIEGPSSSASETKWPAAGSKNVTIQMGEITELRYIVFKGNACTVKIDSIVFNYPETFGGSEQYSVLSTNGTWNAEAQKWTPSGTYGGSALSLNLNEAVTNAVKVDLTLTSGCTTGQNVIVNYSDGTAGGWVSIDSANKVLSIALDHTKTVTGFTFNAGASAADLTIHKIDFTCIKDGQELVIEDITDKISVASSSSSTVTYTDNAMKFEKAWAVGWFELGLEQMPTDAVYFSVEFSDVVGSQYTYYKDGNDKQVSPAFSTINSTSSSRVLGISNPNDGLKYIGWSANAVGNTMSVVKVTITRLVSTAPVYLATVGEQGFATVEEAFIYAAANNGTVKLLTNYTVPELVGTIGVESGKNVGIDLNGYEFSSAYGAVVANGGTLTVTDSTGNANAFDCAINAEGVLNLSGDVDVSNITLASTGSVVATGYTGTATVTLNPAIEAGQSRVVATGNSGGTFISAQGYTVGGENGEVTFTNNAVLEDNCIVSADGTKFDLTYMIENSVWDNANKTWTPGHTYRDLTFATSTPVANAVIAKITLTSGCKTGQNVFVVYEDGSEVGGWISIKNERQIVAIVLDPAKRVKGFHFASGETIGDLTIHEVSFTAVPEGKVIESIDITDNLAFPSWYSGSITYDSENKAVTYGTWSTAWFEIGLSPLPTDIISFTVEYESLPIKAYGTYQDGQNPAVTVEPAFNATDIGTSAKTYAVNVPEHGFRYLGITGSGAGTVKIKSVKLNRIVDDIPAPVTPSIVGASLELKSDLSIIYYADATPFTSGLYTNPVAYAAVNGEFTKEISPVVDSYGNLVTVNQTVEGVETPCYMFKYEEISPANMTSVQSVLIQATDSEGNTVRSAPKEMSVQKYGNANAGGIGNLATLAQSLLNYGAYTEIHLNGGGSSTVNSTLTEAQKQVSNPFAAGTKYGCFARTAVEGATEAVKWYSASLTLNDSIAVNFFFNLNGVQSTNGMYAEITYGLNGDKRTTIEASDFITAESNKYRIKFNDMSAADLSSKISVVIKDAGGNTVSKKLDYSVLDYAYNMSNRADSTDDFKNLLYSMVKYIASVDNYTGKFSYLTGMHSVYTDYGFTVPETFSFAPSAENVKHLGRAYYTADNALWLGYSGSGAEFTFTGSQLGITIQGADSLQYWDADTNMPRYAIYIDGAQVVDNVLSCLDDSSSRLEATHTFTDLGNTAHTVRIIKLSSASAADCAITSITASGAISPTANKEKLIEFVGDSITCGYGIEGANQNEAYTSATENITKTYGYIAAQDLGYDYSFASLGGHGVVTVNPANHIQDYYTKIGGHGGGNKWQGTLASDVEWAFSRQADIVVVNIGTNDNNYVNATGLTEDEIAARKAEFEDNYITLLTLIHSKNPNAKIVCTLGTMNYNLWDNVVSAASTYKAQSGKAVYTYKITPPAWSNGANVEGMGSDWHPSATSQARAGHEISAFITNSVINGSGSTEQPTPELTSYAVTADNVRPLGRTFSTGSGNSSKIWLGWSASGVEFTFTGTALSVTLEGDDAYNSWLKTDGANIPRYAIIVDDKVEVDQIMLVDSFDDTTNHTVTHLIDNLSNKEHTVKIIKLSSAGTAGVAVASIKANGVIAPTLQNSKLIEFIGDSITCGVGTEANNTSIAAAVNCDSENSTNSYGYLAANSLNADYSLISIAGYGVSETGKKVPDFYGKAVAKVGPLDGTNVANATWSFEREADVVVINLGTNDNGYINAGADDAAKETRREEFRTNYAALLATVRANNPDAKIVCTLGTMNKNLWSEIQAIVASCGDANVFAYEMTTAHANGPVDAHPSVAVQQSMAEEIAAYISSILN